MAISRNILRTAVVVAALSATPVSAEPITGGTTDVTLTAAPTLTDLGLTAAATGTATVTTDMAGIPTFMFPITGGDTDALIYHEGSGILFTGGMSCLEIGNFVIDVPNALITGDAIADGTALGSVPLFTIGAGTSLLLTAEAAGAFTMLFGAPDLTGVTVGFAEINAVTSAIPEPGTWLMMLLGFGTIGYALRRRPRHKLAPV